VTDGHFRARVLEALARLEPGDVVSYSDLGAAAGYPGTARGVGAVLAGSGDAALPWWRVVYADGRLVPGHEAEQTARLVAEGVEVRHGHVAGLRSERVTARRGGSGGATRAR
jgi:alkylated DNA nucleotide flippase Atl1